MNKIPMRTAFSPLNNSDKIKLIKHLVKKEGTLVIWKKGSDKKYNLIFHYYDGPQKLAYLVEENKEKRKEVILLDKQNILMYIELNGMNYFSKSTLEWDEKQRKYLINFQEDIFKCERRKNFRLPFTSRTRGYIKLDLEKGRSEKFEILNLSLSGVAFLIPVEWTGQMQEKVSNIFLEVDDKQYKIENAKVVYRMQYPELSKAGIESDRVALEFIELDRSIEDDLYHELTKRIKDYDFSSEFERYLD